MIEFVPYFAAIVTVLFTIAFSYAITDGWSSQEEEED